MYIDEKIEVQQAIQSYIDAWKRKDVENFESLFHDKFVMIGPGREGTTFYDVKAMLPTLSDPEKDWSNYTAVISSVRVAGDVADAVIEESGFAGRAESATNYFQLAKVNGKWLITAKSYHFH